MIKRYTKKPVTIEALQWTGDNLAEVLQFTGKHPDFNKWFSSFEDYKNHVESNGFIFKILTLEGSMKAAVGDYIIRGVHGEYYPCKPDIFDKTYEPESSNNAIQAAKVEAVREFVEMLLKGANNTWDGLIIHGESVEYMRDQYTQQLRERSK